MKAGDILVSSACTATSWGIRLSTRSRFSHAALAISDQKIIEATPAGVLPVSLDSFVDNNSRVLLLERPTPLTEEQLVKLIEGINQKQGSPYNLLRTLNSGLSQFGFNFGLLVLIVLTCFLSLTGQWLYISFFIAAMLVPMGLLYISANPVKSNRIFRKLGVPERWLIDLSKHFCSQLVFDLDSAIGGGLKEKWKKPNEPRPKDIKKLAIQKGFTPVIIKPNKALQRTSRLMRR
ncbi:hypothetical protein [Pseudomonas luteola]|uniref:hypothetical protein n=1 Tax=Pseudomonas TaxID=286 RepID=UPI00388EDDD8